VYLVLGVGLHGGVYSLLPRLAARRDRRIGWSSGRPGPINRAGLVLVGAGATFIAGAAVGHHRAAPNEARPSTRPDYLATSGAYAVSRTPLYVGGMTMWFGWATFLGSRRAAAVGVAWLLGLATLGVPYEEKMLTNSLGDAYAAYCDRVPRWL
jgi:protein-S-isoprenylcysteine O-methyltransferase Ste14